MCAHKNLAVDHVNDTHESEELEKDTLLELGVPSSSFQIIFCHKYEGCLASSVLKVVAIG